MFLPRHRHEAHAEVFDHFADVAVDGPDSESLLFGLAEIEELVYERGEPLGVGLHRAEPLVQFGVGVRAGLGQDVFQGAPDQGEGRADLVGDIREEIELRDVEFPLLPAFDLFDFGLPLPQRERFGVRRTAGGSGSRGTG